MPLMGAGHHPTPGVADPPSPGQLNAGHTQGGEPDTEPPTCSATMATRVMNENAALKSGKVNVL
jgi:hypothetical protein